MSVDNVDNSDFSDVFITIFLFYHNTTSFNMFIFNKRY